MKITHNEKGAWTRFNVDFRVAALSLDRKSANERNQHDYQGQPWSKSKKAREDRREDEEDTDGHGKRCDDLCGQNRSRPLNKSREGSQ